MCDFMKREEKKRNANKANNEKEPPNTIFRPRSQINSKKVIDFNTNTKANHKN